MAAPCGPCASRTGRPLPAPVRAQPPASIALPQPHEPGGRSDDAPLGPRACFRRPMTRSGSERRARGGGCPPHDEIVDRSRHCSRSTALPALVPQQAARQLGHACRRLERALRVSLRGPGHGHPQGQEWRPRLSRKSMVAVPRDISAISGAEPAHLQAAASSGSAGELLRGSHRPCGRRVDLRGRAEKG